LALALSPSLPLYWFRRFIAIHPLCLLDFCSNKSGCKHWLRTTNSFGSECPQHGQVHSSKIRIDLHLFSEWRSTTKSKNKVQETQRKYNTRKQTPDGGQAEQKREKLSARKE